MKYFKPFSLAIVISFLPLLTLAQPLDDNADAAILDSLLQTMNVSTEIFEIPRAMGGLFEQNPIGVSEQVNEKIMNSYAKAFNPDSMTAVVRKNLKKHFKPAYADTVLTWSRNDSIQHILHIEKEFNSLQGYRKQVIGKYELDQNPPTEIRLMLIEALQEETGATEHAVESYGTIFKSFLLSINKLSPTRNFSDTQIANFVDNYRAQMSSELDRELKNEYLVKYHEVSYDALSNYIDFFQTPSGQWINSTLHNGIQSAYKQAANTFVNSLSTPDTTRTPSANEGR